MGREVRQGDEAEVKTSIELNELATALAEFQALVPIIPKNHSATIKMKAGGEFNYNYADLADIIEAIQPHKKACGLSVLQSPGYQLLEKDGDQTYVHTLSTRLLHVSGQWVEESMILSVPGDIQTHGSAITYARRYAQAAILGLVTDKDDDGTLAAEAYGADSKRTRTRRAPAAATSTRRSRPAQDPETAGKVAMAAQDRNKLIRHFARNMNPPITETPAVLSHISALLNENVTAVAKLTAEQGAELFQTLGIE
jgi:hypothetical protein